MKLNSELEITQQRQKLIEAGNMHWFHWFIVGLSVVVTFAAWYISSEQIEKSAEERFQRESEQVVDLVKERMALYENALWGAVAMVDSKKGEISYLQWLDYSSSLKIDEVYPGINGIGVIFNIQPEQMDAFLTREKVWRPNFKLHPEHNETEFWPITYIEPTDANRKAIGLDMAFETNRYTGIKKARDTGKAQLTGPITLVQDSKKTPGFLFYAPFYQQGSKPDSIEQRRKNIVGVTYAPFIMYKLMQGTLAAHNRHVSIKINDAGELLYEDSGNSEDEIDPVPLFQTSANIQLYGREWAFNIASNLSFREASSSNQPAFILVGGLVIDSLLLGLFLFLSRANRRALAYADKMTEQVKKHAENLEKSNRDLEQFAYIASHDLKSPLNAIQKLVSWIEEDMGDDIPESSKEHLVLLRGRSSRMSKLLDDLLDYSRVGFYNFTIEPVELDELVNDIIDLIDKPEGFSINFENASLLIARTPMHIVLRNIISNAIKHHDKETGTIQISYEALSGFHYLRIQDDGPGIPPDMHDKAVEMFQTMKPRDHVEGSGMGLALSKRITEHYGGDLSIDSDGGRGTCIVISWPATE